ncbi:MAG: hypothetical protein AAF195_02005, partial [Pseudomonadota bacterium]
KAIYLTENYFSKHYSKDKENTKVPGSESKIKKYWKHNKSVAHFWAAYHFLMENKYFIEDIKNKNPLTDTFQKDALPNNDSELCLFVSIAEEFKEYGLNAKPSNSKPNASSVLNTRELWLFSNDLKFEKVEIHLDKLEDWQIEALKRYRSD